jgi:hypothetical protein
MYILSGGVVYTTLHYTTLRHTVSKIGNQNIKIKIYCFGYHEWCEMLFLSYSLPVSVQVTLFGAELQTTINNLAF